MPPGSPQKCFEDPFSPFFIPHPGSSRKVSRRHSKKNREEKKRVEEELAEREASREATTGKGTGENPPAAAAHESLKSATIPENEASPEAEPKASSEASREGKPSGTHCATTACAGDAEPDRESPLSGKEEQTEKDQKEGKPEEPEALGTQEESRCRCFSGCRERKECRGMRKV